MGKSSYPEYSGGTVTLNGQTKATSYRKGNNVYTDYNMSDAEKKAYDYAQNSFADGLSQVNVFSPQTLQGFNDQLAAYTKQGQKVIEDTYSPMLESLKTDIARRFGNFDNSSFMDQLNKIEDKRSDSYAALAQDVMSQRDSLINNELSNRYTYLNFLSDVYNSMNETATGFMNAAAQNSASGNKYNAEAYQAKLRQQQMYANLASNIVSTAGTIAGAPGVTAIAKAWANNKWGSGKESL